MCSYFVIKLSNAKVRCAMIAMLLILLINNGSAWCTSPLPNIKIVIQNSQNFPRINEVISISRYELKSCYAGYFPLVKEAGKICITQLIDKNEDGRWDFLLVQVSMLPQSKDTLILSWIKHDPELKFAKRTNVRFSLRTKTSEPGTEIKALKRERGFTQDIADPVYQMEGPGIENDKVAFRTFFDSRNSEDIYGKITAKPILEKVGVGASWHTLQSWGMDIFKTGNSLGAGGLAIEENKQYYRLADADTTFYQALYNGPLQSAFKLTFKNWDIGSGHGNGSEVISMTKGDYFYRNDIEVTLNPNQYLISGIANFIPDSLVYKKHNAKLSSVSVYGPQAEGTQTNLGVAIIFPTSAYLLSHTKSSSAVIPNNSYVELTNLPSVKKTIYFVACWEKTDPSFATEKGFQDYLAVVAKRLANPISVKIIHSKYSY